ncbi:NADH-quinone oxidoreductase subunit NuoF [Candidatus Sumerlaeota bacterium]|nr:NADH-quinone oxidoreductase subunit NuoF [Candidatus Sumerlaeota bacterium]
MLVGYETLVSDFRESLDSYRNRGGYEAFDKVLRKLKPEDVQAEVKSANLRGRGGAGFPAGVKWGFLPKEPQPGAPHYLTVNADESEPGTFNNRPILEQYCHTLLEGIGITCFAIQSHHAFIFVRGEYFDAQKNLNAAIREAEEAGILGDKCMGHDYKLKVTVHSGAGAYICGEETSLLEALEGRRGYPRLRPPFPAIKGLYQCPTLINNVETIAWVPMIFRDGVDEFKKYGTEKSGGPTIYSISGHVKKPGNYEAPQTVTLRDLIYHYAGGIRNDNKFKMCFPGGTSVPLFFEDALDVMMDFDSPPSKGSFLGSKAIQVMDETVCPVWVCLNTMHFYRHESCGQCTPCREGSSWMYKILTRLERGTGTMEDIDMLEEICDKISGRSICALGDFSTAAPRSAIKRLRHEFEEHVKQGCCPFKDKMDWHEFK